MTIYVTAVCLFSATAGALPCGFSLMSLPGRIQEGVFVPNSAFQTPIETTYAEGFYSLPLNHAATQEIIGMQRKQKDLQQFLRKYLDSVNGPLLEVGPFYNPSLDPAMGREIVYWDKDLAPLRKLSESGGSNVSCIFVDFNHADPDFMRNFSATNKAVLGQRQGYGAVVLSQVLNYVDFRSVLNQVSQFQSNNGLIFVVNAVNHGDRSFFHPLRPRNSRDIENYLERLGYEVLERTQSWGLDQTVTLVAKKIVRGPG
jgi:hypothetical protein